MQDGKIVAACEQERYSGKKHSREFPIYAINDCLKIAKINITDITEIAFCDRVYFSIVEMYLKPLIDNDASKTKYIFRDIEKINRFLKVEDLIREKLNYKGKIQFYSHHLCHLAGAYFSSGFKNSLAFSFDGIGDNVSSHFGVCKNGNIDVIHSGSKFPDSLGLFYSAITDYLGWRHHCDEGIIMALASYGNPYEKVPNKSHSYIHYMRKIIKDSKGFEITIVKDFISYHYERDSWVSKKFIKIFGPRRKPNAKINKRHQNIAAALQQRIEEIVLKKVLKAKKIYKIKKLCLSGGLALNCVMNGKIESKGIFDEVFVQPASGDNGQVIGACYLAYKKYRKNLKLKRSWDLYMGSEYIEKEIINDLKNSKIKFCKIKNIFLKTAEKLKSGKVIGWFQGKSEFGPRALGNRSILARPYPLSMKSHINFNIKYRENFRPLAPAILKEKVNDYFFIKQDSPHMLIACKVKKKYSKQIEATIHCDNTARVQTVTKKSNNRFWKLIKAFDNLTSCPVILNTSFNIKGQPIVNSPREAIKCFLKTKIDCLVIGDFFIEKK